MKTKIITIALFTVTSLGNLLIAQEATVTAPPKASYDLKKNVKARVSQTEGKIVSDDDGQTQNQKIAQGQHIKKAIITCRLIPSVNGCVITMENSVQSPRDVASGLPTGKRMHKPLSIHVSSTDNAVTEIKSSRDAASGLPTGKRMHKPNVLTPELDKSSPNLAKSSFDSPPAEIAIDEPGVQKVSIQDFHFSMTCGGKTTQISCPDGVCEIPLEDCPDGSCSGIASWSWGATNSGSMSSGSGMGSGRCSVGFSLEVEGGACTAMAINEKGLPGEKKPNKTKTNNPK